MKTVRSQISGHLKQKMTVAVTLVVLTVWVLSTFYDDGGIHIAKCAIHTINVTTVAKQIQIQYDPTEEQDRFKDHLEIAKLCTWGNEPKASWQQHFHNIFHKYNMTLTGKSYPELKCNATFKPTLMENMDVVLNYQFDISDTHLERLSLDKKGIDELSKPVANPRKYPILVTASSSNHYRESQGLIQTYHKLLTVHPELEMIFYDIGLTCDQRQELMKYCKCEVRTFEVEKYPTHVSEKRGYAWKPVIIQTVLKEYDFVMWVDASIRFKRKPLDEVSLLARQRGIQTMHSGGAICQMTSKISFEYLGETPCLFNLPEIQGGWMLISRNRFTLEYIMKPWASCGLSYNCMVYDNSLGNLYCKSRQTYHDCHRFDQSILGIVLSRLFNQQRHIVDFNVSSIFSIVR